MSRRIAVIHEADADFRTATELADRVLLDAIDWLEEDQLIHHREWFAKAVGGERLTWKGVKQLATDLGIRAHGHFDGEPGEADAAAGRRAILYLREAFPELAGVVLIRDQDDQPERRGGLEQARRQEDGRVPVVVGLAVVERECWVISGFDPQDDDEKARLSAVRQTLPFDPCLQSHQLTACKNDLAPRSPKRVLRLLTEGHHHRERRCWSETSLQTLRDRGEHNGLAMYLDEVRTRLAVLIGHVS